MSEQSIYEVAISAQPSFQPDKVSVEELNLLNAFFPEILKEMMQFVDLGKE